MSHDDGDSVDSAADECLDIFWPFLESDYGSRSKSSAIPNDIIKLQVLTMDGALRSINHNLQMEFPRTKAIDNIFSGVATYESFEVELLDKIEMHIYKVKLRDSTYCLKTVHRTGNETDFVREVSILRQCSHPNIIRLVGLVKTDDQEDKIEGMLMDYVECAQSLRDIKSIDVRESEQWAAQIRDAIDYLHAKGLVWGDAKAANVLIDGKGNAALIDFGGGVTKGWVDSENYGTHRGDLQGLERIISFMKGKSC